AWDFIPMIQTLIPPSRYHGRRQYALLTEQLRRNSADDQQTSLVPSFVPSELDLIPARIDQSQLAIVEPHHLRFAQPRAIGRDNSAMLDALTRVPERLRGVTSVAPS